MVANRNIYTEWVNYCCYLHGIIQNDLAKRIGVTSGTIGAWVNGRGHPHIRVIKRMVDLSEGKFKASDFISGLD